MANDFDFLIQQCGEAAQPCQVGIAIRVVLDRMGAVQERWHVLIAAVELRQRIRLPRFGGPVRERLVRCIAGTQAVHHDVVASGIGATQGVAIEGLKARKLAGGDLLLFGDAGQ